MANKPFIRSVRFSQETYDAINNQIGDNFSEKLENMIVRCMFELPEKEEELAKLDKAISHRRHLIARLVSEYQSIQGTFCNISMKLSDIASEIQAISLNSELVDDYVHNFKAGTFREFALGGLCALSGLQLSLQWHDGNTLDESRIAEDVEEVLGVSLNSEEE